VKIFCNTTFDATKSLITAQANNNLASFPTLYFEDKLPIEIVFVEEGGEVASFVGQAGNLITIAIGNLETRQIITQAILDSENKAVLDIGTAEFFYEMQGLEQKTFIFEIQICFSTGKTRTLCQQNCQVKNQIIGTEITAPTLVRPNPPTEIFAGAFPNPPMNVVPGFSPISIFEIDAVNWTNLSEINLSGEKLLNPNFEPPAYVPGTQVEVLESWTSSGYTTIIGEILTIVLSQSNGSFKFTNSSGQTTWANAQQANDLTKSSHPGTSGQEVETITEFSENLVGRTIRALQNKPARGLVIGGLYTIQLPITATTAQTNVTNLNNGIGGISIGGQGSQWELLGENTKRPYQWEVVSGTIDQDQLEQNIIQGKNGAVGIKQMFDNPLIVGTKLVIKATRLDNQTGNATIQTLNASGNSYGTNISFYDFTEFEVTDQAMYGVKLDTNHGLRQVDKLSLFQGAVSGGTVQANPNGGLEKISGVSGFNAGASSTNFIDGNSNGYFQFQWAANGLKVGLAYQDADFSRITPFQILINFNGSIVSNDGFSLPVGYASPGDNFRIRHYQVDNTVHFQRKENIYTEDTTAQIAIGAVVKIKIPFVKNNISYELNEIVEIITIGTTQNLKFQKSNNENTFIGIDKIRGTDFEIVEPIGQDYVTFHTHSNYTNGNNLYFDTSMYGVGSQINDVLLAK
jgi:hypothetical protein